MKKALTAVLIVLLALFMVACDSNPNDEQTPPPEEKTVTPEWVDRGEHKGYVVIRVKGTDTIINSSDSTFTVTDDNIVFEVKDDTGKTVYKATADADNASDNNVDTESWTLNVKNIAHPNPSEQATTNATVVVKNNESGKPVMTIEFEAADLNSLIYSFEHEKPVIEPTFAPDWAVSDKAYSGKIAMNLGDYPVSLDSTLTISEEVIAVVISIPTIGPLNISSASPATVDPNDKGLVNDGIWNLTINNIPITIEGSTTSDTVAELTVKRDTPKQKLIVTIKLTEGDFASMASMLDMESIEFTVTE